MVMKNETKAIGDRDPSSAVRRRWGRIIEQVRNGNGHVSELSSMLGVSESTIRRDLRRMSNGGWLTRTYGGAVHMDSWVERTLGEKEQLLRRQKIAIANRAASLVRDGESLLLDAGSTVGFLAEALKHRENLTVVTNGINSVLKLRDAKHVSLIVLGGQVRAMSQAVLGSMTLDNMRLFSVDKVFLGADGVDSRLGISCPTLEQAYLKNAMVAAADKVFILADHTKIGARPFAHWARLAKPYTVITDAGVESIELATFLQNPDCEIIQSNATDVNPDGLGDESMTSAL